MTKAPAKAVRRYDARQPARDTRTGHATGAPIPEGLLHEGIFRIACNSRRRWR